MLNVPLRISPSGPELTGAPADVGKPLVIGADGKVALGPAATGGNVNLSLEYFVDPATPVALANQTGNIEAPFATLAQALAVASGDAQIWSVPGDYSAEGALVISTSIGCLSPISNLAWQGIYSNAIWSVASGVTALGYKLQLIGSTGGVNCTDVSSRAILDTCWLSQLIGLGFGDLTNCRVDNVCDIGRLLARNSVLGCAINVTGTDVQFLGCDFGDSVVLTFLNAPGVASFDGPSLSAFFERGCSIVNGVIARYEATPPHASVPIVVPAVLAGSLDYVSTSLVGTPLAGYITAANQSIIVTPESDIGSGPGVGIGGLLYAYADGADSVRCAFIGGLAGGAANFTITVL